MLLAPYVVDGLVLTCFYLLISLGLTMIYGILRIIHIAHAAIYALGAYLTVSFFFYNLLYTIILATIITGLIGVLLCWGLYGGLFKASKIVTLVIAVGLYIAATDFWRLIFGPHPKSIPEIFVSPSLDLGVFKITYLQIQIMTITLVILLMLYLFLKRTKLGLDVRATAQNMNVASAFGINVRVVITFIFLLSSLLAGFSGAMTVAYYISANPQMGDLTVSVGLAVMVLGGLGSIGGTIIAALIIAMSQSLFVAFFPQFLPPYSVAFIILIIVLILRPRGLFGIEV